MKVCLVNAFSEVPFKGNTAGVCLLEDDRDDAVLQGIAAELNLSETAFLRKVKPNEFNLRWFTPETEVSLCGHATLASAHVLWENNLAERSSEIRFNTQSGLLSAAKDGDWIVLDFPKGNLKPSAGDDHLFEALKASPIRVFEDDIVYLLEFENEAAVRSLKPDFLTLLKARKEEIIVTAPACNEVYDFVSRFFGPAIGINEDPVTGSAHCYLAPFWAERLGKDSLIGFQASRRTGFVRCQVTSNRVKIQGKAVTILDGNMHI